MDGERGEEKDREGGERERERRSDTQRRGDGEREAVTEREE